MSKAGAQRGEQSEPNRVSAYRDVWDSHMRRHPDTAILRLISLTLWLLLFGIEAPLSRAQSVPEQSPSAESVTNKLSIDLPTALRLAGAQNLDIKLAKAKVEEARANAESATWQFFPSLSPGVGWRRHDNLIQDVGGTLFEAHKESYAVGPTLSGQIDFGDAIYKRLAARQLAKAADFALASQQQDTILAAAQGYFDLARARAGAVVAAESVRISADYGGQVEQAAEAGIAFRGDALRVQVQTERNRLTLRQAQEQERLAGARLAEVLRLEDTTELEPSAEELVPLTLTKTNVPLHNLVIQALASRPEIKQSRAFQEAAREAKNGAVYGPLIPSLGAQVFAGGLGGGKDGTPSKFGESEDYQVTLGWRIGPGGLFDRGRVHATSARLQIAELNRQKLMDEITRQVLEAHTRVQSLGDQVDTAGRAVRAAEETLRLTRQRREFAVGIVLENIQAEQDLTRARLDYVNAVAEFNKAQYQLRKAAGD